VGRRAGLLGAAGIQFDPVPQGLFVASDLREGAPIPDTRIQRGEWRGAKCQIASDAFGLCDG